MANDRRISMVVGAVDEMSGTLNRLQGNLRQFQREMDETGGAGQRVNNSFGGMTGAFSAFRSGVAALGLGLLARDLVQVAVATDRMTNQMAAASGGIGAGRMEMEYVRAEAQRLGLDLRQTAGDYAQLAASARGTRLEGQSTRDIFSAVAETSTVMGLSAEETGGVIRALGQMMSKGTVQAEELKGQLGERIPGAFNMAARAMGVTTSELGKMLEKGEVLADDLLPKLAVEMRRTYGDQLPTAVESAQAEINRFHTALFDLKREVMEGGGKDVFITLTQGATGFAESLRDVVRELGNAYNRIENAKGFWGTLEEIQRSGLRRGMGQFLMSDPATRALIEADRDISVPMGSEEPLLNRIAADKRAAGLLAGSSGQSGTGGKPKRPGWATSPTSKTFFSQAWDRAADELAFEEAQGFVLKVNDLGAGLKFGPDKVGLLGPVDLLAPPEKDPNKEKRTEIERETTANILALRYGLREESARLMGEEEAALDLHYQNEAFRMETDYQTKLGYARQIGADTNLIQQEYLLQREQMEQESAARRAEIWWGNAQTYIGFAQQMTTMGVQMLLFEEGQRGQIGRRMLGATVRFIAQGLQAYMFGKAKEHVIAAAAAAGRTTTDMAAANANLGILGAQAGAWAAFYTAMSLNPYGGQAFIPAATAMTAVAGGAVPAAIAAVNTVGASSIASELALAGAWTVGGIAVGALGEAGASAIEGGTAGATTPAGYGGGSYGSPIVTQPISTPQQPVQQVTIVLKGVPTGKWIEEELVPELNAAGNRNVRIEYL